MIAAGDVIRIVLSWVMDGSDVMQNVLHYKHTAGPSADTALALNDIVTKLAGDWTAHWAARVADNVIGTVVELYKFNPATGQFDGLVNQSNPMDGASANDMTAQGVAMLGLLQTDLFRYQGRKYLGGMIKGSLGSDGTFTVQALLDAALLLGDWVDSVDSFGATLTPGVFNAPTQRFNAFNDTVIVPAAPGYQRRRRENTGI